jgi:hypothetical protein
MDAAAGVHYSGLALAAAVEPYVIAKLRIWMITTRLDIQSISYFDY